MCEITLVLKEEIGKYFVRVLCDASIPDVKQAYFNKSGSPIGINLQYNGMVLSDTKNLADYNIKDGDELNVMKEMDGGKR